MGPRTLTARLVVTAVVLVAAVSLLIGTATTLVMRDHLLDQLDGQAKDGLTRTIAGETMDGPGPGGPPPDGRLGRPSGFGLEIGTIVAVYHADGSRAGQRVATDRIGAGAPRSLPDGVLDALEAVRTDGRAERLDLPELGSYQTVAQEVDGDTFVVALPTEQVDETLTNLLWLEVLLAALGVVGVAVAGTVVVRRQLRPLREVAATAHSVATLPLASGDIALTERVPDRLTDERTEVGQVGAALNTLLAHVEGALDARQRSEAQVRQFVADASHELRTPLATVQGYVELAARRPDDAEGVRAALARVETASHRMADLVEDLLLLARLDSGRPLEREPVDLTRLVLEAVGDARMLGPEHQWRLDLPDEPVEVIGDEQRLHQVLTNLLTNARTHTPPGTVVTVSARPGEVRVHDDGPGFPTALGDNAFERFTRGDDARVRGGDTGGAGLGLSLVQAIVAAHGGDVALDSRPGDTTVIVRLPG